MYEYDYAFWKEIDKLLWSQLKWCMKGSGTLVGLRGHAGNAAGSTVRICAVALV